MPRQQTTNRIPAVSQTAAPSDKDEQPREHAIKQIERKRRFHSAYVVAAATMKIEYLHASKYGNGAAVAAEFKRHMAGRGALVEIHHIREVKPRELPSADLYVFSSPGRFGKPIGGMRRFLRKVTLPADTRYAVLTTEVSPKPDKKTGRTPTEQELARWQRVRAVMNEMLQDKGLVKVAEEKVYVTGLKGPLEAGWQEKLKAFAATISKALERPAAREGGAA